MSRVLIVGASKGIGLECVKQALEAGHSVRALARSAHSIPLTHPNLEKVDGDARDAALVTQALQGMDAVILALGIAAGPEMVFRRVTLFSDATRVLLAAMQSTGVRRLVCVTGFGAGDSRARGGCLYNAVLFPIFLKRAYDDKDIQEWMIRKADLDWVIARPGLLTRGARTGNYRVLTDPAEWRIGSISRRDVADFLVKQLEDDRYLGQTPVLID